MDIDELGVGWKGRRCALEVGIEEPHQAGVDRHGSGSAGSSHVRAPCPIGKGEMAGVVDF